MIRLYQFEDQFVEPSNVPEIGRSLTSSLCCKETLLLLRALSISSLLDLPHIWDYCVCLFFLKKGHALCSSNNPYRYRYRLICPFQWKQKGKKGKKPGSHESSLLVRSDLIWKAFIHLSAKCLCVCMRVRVCVCACARVFYLITNVVVWFCLYLLSSIRSQPWNVTDVQIHLAELHKSKLAH